MKLLELIVMYFPKKFKLYSSISPLPEPHVKLRGDDIVEDDNYDVGLRYVDGIVEVWARTEDGRKMIADVMDQNALREYLI